MGQSVIKLKKQELKKVVEHYKPYSSSKKPPYSILAAKTNGCAITIYESGKVLFQGSTHAEEAAKWSDGADQPKQKSNHQNMPDFLKKDHIGSDEAGTGDYFGPITVAAVFVTARQQALLKELGVKDSKSMNDETIKKIVNDMLQTDMVYSSLTLNNEKYNQLQRRGWSQGRMKAWMHHHAIQNVLGKLEDGVKPSGILVDQFCKPDIFYNHVQATGDKPRRDLSFMTKAESYSTSVAAASMIARYRFVQEMEKLSKVVGFDLQKGASKVVDQQIKRIVNSRGQALLDKIAKVHFANTKKAL
ncbi:ribonuclease HIII [Tenuibacillus multivorans]|uniref:Ribonuclease HIII n=1 Tax=Tenuibacillus multivorans TaxID=237069 RepID=A0A1G9ZRB3_9BACI|nr:ribonuclease HIII [Tenuibacillus multivorans]GEL76816.1 ribonuclease HIII [Tenuibacillus multivorans]SDN23645.1 ribonuclease HIII [Tenuibacillus multivorans]